MDDCDFSRCTASQLVYAEPQSKVVIRNTVLGDNNCESRRLNWNIYRFLEFRWCCIQFMHVPHLHAKVSTLRDNTVIAYPGYQCMDVYRVPVTPDNIPLFAWYYLAYPSCSSISSPTLPHTIHGRLSLSRPLIPHMPGHAEL